LVVLRGMVGDEPDDPAEFTALRFDGTTAPVEVSVSVMADEPDAPLLCFVRDVSRRRSLEEQVRQSQKLDALGHLAAGIAHDFNNVLNIILAHAELALAGVDSAGLQPTTEQIASLREDLLQIAQSSEKGASITKRLLVFSRRGSVSPRVLDVRNVIREMYEMLEPCVGPKISLTQDLGEVPCLARVDPGFLEQSVLNLVVNARDAMPDGGTIQIALRRELNPQHIAVNDAVGAPKPHVVLEVRDNGVGMSAEVKAKIFEPFFTTKAPGQGTGLGLATVYGFVKQSSGHIAVESQPGSGTSFSIFLPETSEPMDLAADSGNAPRSRGDETVLLVEDNEMLRGATKRILESHGYRVLEAASHRDVLDRCRSFSGPIHLLLSDIMLPDIDGIMLAEKARELRGDIRVVLMTGYFEPLKDRALSYPVLQKPCTAGAILNTVRSTLDEVAPSLS
ncbi:MAG: ATP-binding protein, partial [Polyangiaceae bacterium]